MTVKESVELVSGCKIVPIPSVSDARGKLAFVEACHHIPFDIKRVFWIYNVPAESRRGAHAHRTCAEVVFPVAGAFTLTLDDGNVRRTVRLDSPEWGALIPAGVWCELTEFQTGTVLLCLASQDYDSTGYIHDYNQFLKEKRA